MSNFYIDERLLDAAGLSNFQELFAYIKEHYSKQIGELSLPVPIGGQTLQQQVKNNDDIIYGSGDSNEEFEPPVPNVIMKLDLSSQLERQSFLASSGSNSQLIVYGDRITLTASYATTGLFPCGDQLGGQLSGYLFKSSPHEARPKLGDQVIALVGKDSPNIYNIFCQFEAQSYVYEAVKKQTDLIEAGVQELNRTNYLYSEIKLMDELAIFKADRAAYFIKDGPFITHSFGAKLAQLGINSEMQQTIYKLFSTIGKKVLPPNIKYMPIHVEQQEFSAMRLFKDIYDKSSAVQVAVSGQLNMFDCEFQGTYILENYVNGINTNESAFEDVQSHIYEVIIKHEIQLDSSLQPQYMITNMFNQLAINDFFPSSVQNTFYIVDDGTCRACVLNLYSKSKGLQERTQEVSRISDAEVPDDGKTVRLFSKIKQLVQKVGKGLQLADDNIYRLFIEPFAKSILGALGPVGQTIDKGLKSGSNHIRKYTIYHRDKTIDGSLQNDATTESIIYNTVKPQSEKNIRKLIHSFYENIHKFDTSACGTYIRLHAEPLTESELKNLVCGIKPVTICIKNYVITEVTANMAGYKSTDACLNRVRQFYSQRPFVVPAQRVEVWSLLTSATLTGIRTSQNIPLSHVTDFCLPFPKDASATTCFENPCYQNMQITTC
ncbi:MAG: hypothetical protein EZS28_003668 [Streblomastix strix]|uniref:Uncharacterized protein n=1 Tax=Streblomastix strix TaxID=222440 RepID=A0A5J4X241_9EUKA|nr:MAG: hypothetical protein EZS28_003668 [Streblomastix strix]